MNYRKIGSTNIEVSEIGIGVWSFSNKLVGS